ncbi:MAG: ATP-binding protein [Ramlibacter sp.]
MVMLYVRDAELQVMVPAPGMPKTVSAGPSWTALLRRCLVEKAFTAPVSLDRTRDNAARVAVVGALALIVVGDETAPCVPAEILDALPLLECAVRAQHASQIELAKAAEARDAVAKAHQLMKALDAARYSAAELNGQLQVQHRAKDEFIAMLAHELRNPLSPIVSTVEILRHAGAKELSPERRSHALDVIARQANQLTRLVDDLLDVSRVSRGHIELRREPLPLGEVLEAAVESVRPLIDGRGQQLTLLGANQIVHVNGDRVRLAQVFANVINNAAKYTGPGGSMQVSVVHDTSRVSVVIQDNGAGIPREMLTSIFDMFTQVPAPLERAAGGLGIGLSLVRTLVKLHGGEVNAHSAGPGKGSTFTITLPTIKAPKNPLPREFPHASGGLVVATVLVVEDNVDAAESLAEILRISGANVAIAHDGNLALDKAAGGYTPDLVLLDIGLPGINGYETAREWRRRFGNRTKLVALTGYGSPDDRLRTAQAGFDAHLVKPVDTEAIGSLLRELALGPPPAVLR